MIRSNRRDFCRKLVGGAAGLALAWPTRQAHAQGAVTATKLNGNFTMFSGAGSNVLALVQPDGVLLVDGGAADRSAELLKAVGELSGGKPVTALFNTCWHPDATGSNDTLGMAGAKIIAHENTRLWMNTTHHVQWQNRTYTPRAKVALPNQTFYTTGKMTFGREEILYGYLGQANTDGDIYVFFPGPDILVTGDTFTVGKYPVLDWSTGGWIGGLSQAHQTMVDLSSAGTKVIPGTGPVQTQTDLKAAAEMSATMLSRFADLMKQGKSAADMFRAEPTKDYDARWGDPKQFIANIYPGLWNHVRELRPYGTMQIGIV
jgi:glyoxylase-like metal-dependent hydrolase (beta-lactamase superfamily II)